MATPKTDLVPEEIAFYHREGYLVVECITTPAEVDLIRRLYDLLFEARAGREEGNQFDLAGADEEGTRAALPQILSPSRYAPELLDTTYRRNALAISRQLLGPDAIAQGDHAILKPAFHGAPTPWHQDEAYWNPDLEYNALSVWMPMQEATLENGCMHFIPGSHLQEVQPHHSINNDPRVHGLEVDRVDPSNAVACPLPAGGATFHHSRTLHYAGPNKTPVPRRAYILGFGTLPKKRGEPRRFPWMEQKTTARQARAEAFQKSADASSL